MIKKLISSVATLGLSVGIISTANAEESIQPSLPIQGNTAIEVKSSITPYNLQRPYSENQYFTKSRYPDRNSIPQSMQKTINDANGVWIGTLYISNIYVYPDGYNVIYTGTLTLY
ncbi:hypothetical protein [Lysinibacillus piscis]|uniref:Uncharacterized protein n=1 Tax=Lysinibacillus piscis TaxID=2518931 RepID=A0ABQ5NPK5_9BACI|nr:hypothetical protein [Lysinibacillus sp. KH24]GLC90296.1 hypothetical protein LYSBPC_34230 [Lysinibacillus sp. KH24]